MESMLAAVYHGPNDLRIERYPVPRIGPDELLLKIESAGICATDLRILQGSHRMFGPGTVRIPGHEIVGMIAEVGSSVRELHEGQRVFIAPNIGCGRCRHCLRERSNLCSRYDAFGITLDGAFAEYMRVTASAIQQGNVIPIPRHLDSATAALAEPFSCVLHGQDAVGVGPNDVVVIQGAGPIGLMHLILARQRGARLILVSDQSRERLQKARELGADRTVNLDEEDLGAVVAAETGAEGVDVVLTAVAAHAAQEQAVRIAAIGGRINFFAGLPKEKPEILIDSNLVHYRELVITGTTACSTADCRKAAGLVSSGQVNLAPLLSMRYALLDAEAALSMASSGKVFKVAIQPNGGDA